MAIEQSNTAESKGHFGVTNPETRAKAMTLPLEDFAEIIDGCLANQAEQSRMISDQIAAIRQVTSNKAVNAALNVIAASTRAWDNDLCDTGAYLEALLNKAVSSQANSEGSKQPLPRAACLTTATSQDEGAEVDYVTFASDHGYQLHRLRFRANAASALLHEYRDIDGDTQLQGVSFMLSDIAELANALAVEIDESSFKYVPASGSAGAAERQPSAQH